MLGISQKATHSKLSKISQTTKEVTSIILGEEKQM